MKLRHLRNPKYIWVNIPNTLFLIYSIKALLHVQSMPNELRATSSAFSLTTNSSLIIVFIPQFIFNMWSTCIPFYAHYYLHYIRWMTLCPEQYWGTRVVALTLHWYLLTIFIELYNFKGKGGASRLTFFF